MRPGAVLGSAQDNGDLRTSRLVVSTLGVVFGDLVTNPLYTMRECFYGAYPVPPTRLDSSITPSMNWRRRGRSIL
jgi:K+ transporter